LDEIFRFGGAMQYFEGEAINEAAVAIVNFAKGGRVAIAQAKI
jgi:type III secretory pathway component EscV